MGSLGARRVSVALGVCAALASCASSVARPVVTAHVTEPERAPSRSHVAPTAEQVAALEALIHSMVQDGEAGRRAIDSVGLSLDRAGGARTLTGEAATDDQVRDASLVARVDDAAAALVTTTCGDAWLIGLRLDSGAWRAFSTVAVIDDAHPGACRITRASAAARAMQTEEAREVIVSFASESEEGDEARDPALRVYELGTDGSLSALSGDLGFGGTDDATGAVREAEWVVDEALFLPRDLYVQVQPGQAGPGGTAPPFVVRRTYRLQQGRLVLVEETSQRVRPRSPPGSR